MIHIFILVFNFSIAKLGQWYDIFLNYLKKQNKVMRRKGNETTLLFNLVPQMAQRNLRDA